LDINEQLRDFVVEYAEKEGQIDLREIAFRIPDVIIAKVPHIQEMVDNWKEDKQWERPFPRNITTENHEDEEKFESDIEAVIEAVVGVSASTNKCDQYNEESIHKAISHK
jgi:hypothetical protein